MDTKDGVIVIEYESKYGSARYNYEIWMHGHSQRQSGCYDSL